MKNRSHRHPMSTAPAEYWDDGSWTVDCPCGITYDDGDEMVDCDECGVWVHTRCSGFVKGDASFTCGKCKIRDTRTSSYVDQSDIRNNCNNEETEVAQLLVEFPNKADLCPPLVRRRPSFGVWREIPMEERVHVHGIPGGDPALFQEISSVFTSSLWNCTGYVPKTFNFRYKEFPCWDNDESENPVNTGASLLFSLSKDIVPSLPCVVPEKIVQTSLKGPIKRDSKVLCNNGDLKFTRKERSKPNAFPVCTGKRKDESVRSRESSVKKNTTYDDKIQPDHQKIGSALIVDEHNVHQNDTAMHTLSSVSNGFKCEYKRVDVSREPPLVTCDKDTDWGKHSVAARAITAVSHDMPNQNSSVELNKQIFFDDLDSMGVKISSGVNDYPTTVHAAINFDQASVKKEDISLADDLKQSNNGNNYLGNVNEKSLNIPTENLENSSGECAHVALENISVGSKGKVETELEYNKSIRDLNVQCSPLSFGNTDPKKYMLQRDMCQSSINSEMPYSEICLGCKIKPDDRMLEAKHQALNVLEEKKTFEEVDVCHLSSNRVIMQEDSSERHTKSCIKCSNSTVTDDHKLSVSVGKASSTLPLPDISKVSHINGYKSPGSTSFSTSTKTAPFTKKVKVNISHNEDKDNEDKIKSRVDKMHGEMSGQSIKVHQDSQLGPSGDKSFEQKTFHTPSKYKVMNSKESVSHSSSKASSMDNLACLSVSAKHSGSSKTHITSMQFKSRTPSSHTKNDGNQSITSPTSQASGKLSNSTAGHLSSPANASATLSDEELAKRLHQELNSSRRVSRVPRGFNANDLQSVSSVGTSMLSKCSSSSGGKFRVVVSKRKNKKETSKSAEERKKLDIRLSHGHRKRHALMGSDDSERGNAQKRRQDASLSTENSTEHISTTDDDSGPNSLTLPALIDGMMNKGKDMTYEELCDAVLPHWKSLRKPDGEQYEYSSHLHAVHDCLRNRNEWAHLIDPTTKIMRTSKKTLDSTSEHETSTNQMKTMRQIVNKKGKSCDEDVPRGKRNTRKRKRLALQGRVVVGAKNRKKPKAPLSDDDLSSGDEQSDSSEGDIQRTRSDAILNDTSTSDDSDKF